MLLTRTLQSGERLVAWSAFPGFRSVSPVPSNCTRYLHMCPGARQQSAVKAAPTNTMKPPKQDPHAMLYGTNMM